MKFDLIYCLEGKIAQLKLIQKQGEIIRLISLEGIFLHLIFIPEYLDQIHKVQLVAERMQEGIYTFLSGIGLEKPAEGFKKNTFVNTHFDPTSAFSSSINREMVISSPLYKKVVVTSANQFPP